MKEEGSEGDAPLALCKKVDVTTNNNNNNGNNPTPCTSPSLTTASLGSTSPYLTSPLSVVARAQAVEATLVALGAEVAAHAVKHAGDEVNDDDADNGSLKSDNGVVGGGGGGGSGNGTGGGGGGRLSARSMVVKDTTGSSAASRDKVFVCSVCNRCFGYKHVLQNHERTHTGEKPFECKECHKRFTRDHHLKTHMRLHTGEKPYHCTHCERQFVQVANLRRHLRVHTGERPYACELCASRFSDSNQLKAHMLIHKGEKPFQCQECMGRFRRRHHLMHHKCPKDETNMDKPRRGRRPKSSEDIEHDSRPLPTVVPTSERPQKRERKSRETRRIIKVGMPPILAIGEGGCSRYPPIITSSYATRPPPISPPEQTEPEDLSMHSIDNGDRQAGRNLSTSLYHHHQPPRPSSVPLSSAVVSHHHHHHHPATVLNQIRTSRAKVACLGIHHNAGGRLMGRISPPHLVEEVMIDDGGSGDGGVGMDDCSSESEAMVEEEEVEEEEEDDELDSDSCGPIRRMESMGEHHHLHQRHLYHHEKAEDDEDDEEEGLSDVRLMVKREPHDDDDSADSNELNQRMKMNESNSETENGEKSRSSSRPSLNKHQLLQYPFHPHHHHLSHHYVHPAHHVVAQNQSVVVVGTGSAVSHSVGAGGAANRGTLERQLLTTSMGGRPVQVSVPLPQLSGIHHAGGGAGSGSMELSGSIRRQARGASGGEGHGEDFS